MFNFRQITLFCLEKRHSKHKMTTIFSTNLGWGTAPLTLPWLCLCFVPPLRNFLRTPLPRSNVEPYTYVTTTPRVTSQKVDITHCTLQGSFWLWLGCWCNKIANSHLSPGPFNSSELRSCLVPQCSHLPHWLCHQRRLVNCDWIPAT